MVTIILVAFIFRLWLIPYAWHVDIFSNAGWGEWIYNNSPLNFYKNNIWTYSWPTQPPLMSLIYGWCKAISIELLGRIAWVDYQLNKLLPGDKVPWLTDFVEWLAFGRLNIYIPFQINFLVTIKLVPVLADILIGYLLYKITKRKLAAVLYLFLPFSWYISAMWGQYDSVGLLFVLLSALSLRSKKLAILGPVLLAVSIFIKPTSLIFLPLALWIFIFKTNTTKLQKVIGLLLPLGLFYLTTKPFTHDNVFTFATHDLKRIIFEKSEGRVAVSAWNFWWFISGGRPLNEMTKYLFIPAKHWSLAMLILINVLGLKFLNKFKNFSEKNAKNAYWYVWAIIGFGSVFMSVSMLERYFLAGISLLLIPASHSKKKLIIWLTMASVFFLNLYGTWKVPGTIVLPLLSENNLIPRLLIVISGICYYKLVKWALIEK